MTVTIELPAKTETLLQKEAEIAGISISDLLARIVSERFEATAQDDSIQALFARIARPAPEIDASREGVYADH